MVNLKLAFVVLMVILAVIIFLAPLFFPNSKKNAQDKGFQKMVKLKLFCFLGILILLLLCIVIK